MRLLTRDTWRHLTGRLGEPADPRAMGRTSPMPDAVCLQCHAPALGPWLEQHYDEARTVGVASCLDCHQPVFCAQCHKAPAGVE